MLEKFEKTWNGRLRFIGMAEHRMKFTASDAQPISSAPTTLGPKARRLEKLKSTRCFA